jgi:hypothetical protein
MFAHLLPWERVAKPLHNDKGDTLTDAEATNEAIPPLLD